VGVADADAIYHRFVTVTGVPPDPVDRGPELEPSAGDLASDQADEATRRAKLLASLSPGRSGVRALVLVVVVVAVTAAFLAWKAQPRAEPVPLRVGAGDAAEVAGRQTTEPAAAGATAATSRTEPGAVVVAVTGKVRKPGLVRLPQGSRVADAIEAAGGVLPGTDLAFVNLARRLVDGELVLIGVTPSVPVEQPGNAAAGAGGSGGIVNLNTATLAELQTLPGVGPVLAQRIVDFRAEHGGFRTVADLQQVDGIGATRYDRLKNLVMV
jgi:competence protein ComEA